jgi:hypothetical protein
MAAATLPQTWLQFLMLEIVRHNAALTRARQKVQSLTVAIHRHIHQYSAPRAATINGADVRWSSHATPAPPVMATIAERRKQFEVERLLLRQAQDHELFLLKQAQDMELLLHELERD